MTRWFTAFAVARAALVLHAGHGEPGLENAIAHALLEPQHALPLVAACLGAGAIVAGYRLLQRKPRRG